MKAVFVIVFGFVVVHRLIQQSRGYNVVKFFQDVRRVVGHITTTIDVFCPLKLACSPTFIIMKFPHCFLFIAILAGFSQCNSGPKKLEDCPYGQPKPIFSKQIPGVTRHSFRADALSAAEELILGDTLSITLIQSGCEKPVQEFRFVIQNPPPQADAAYWADRAVDLLYQLSKLSPELVPLSAWAQAIEPQIPGISLGEPILVEQDTYVSIDRIESAGSVILMLILGAEH